jgi:hypothetical protein
MTKASSYTAVPNDQGFQLHSSRGGWGAACCSTGGGSSCTAGRQWQLSSRRPSRCWWEPPRQVRIQAGGGKYTGRVPVPAGQQAAAAAAGSWAAGRPGGAAAHSGSQAPSQSEQQVEQLLAAAEGRPTTQYPPPPSSEQAASSSSVRGAGASKRMMGALETWCQLYWTVRILSTFCFGI